MATPSPALTYGAKEIPMAAQADARSSINKPRLPAALDPQARRLVDKAIEAHLAAVEGLTAVLAQLPGDPDLDPPLQEASQ